MQETNSLKRSTLHEDKKGGSFSTKKGFEEEEEKKIRVLTLSCAAIYVALALCTMISLVAYAFSVMTLVCRIMEHNRNRHIDVASKTETTRKLTLPKSCPNIEPFGYLMTMKTPLLMLLNCTATLVFIQCLLFIRRWASNWICCSQCCGGDMEFNNWNLPKPRWTNDLGDMFAVSEKESCQLHLHDFILRLTYKTRCQDDLIIRVELPPMSDPAVKLPPRTSVLESGPPIIVDSQRSTEKRKTCLGSQGAASFKMPASLLDASTIEIKQEDDTQMEVTEAKKYDHNTQVAKNKR